MAVLTLLLFSSVLAAADLNNTLQRIFEKHEFNARSFGPARWIDHGEAYTTVESGKILRYRTSTGAALGEVNADPLKIDDYCWSADKTRVLIFTNTQKVWRENTRGDYWVIDLDTNKRHRLGGNGTASSLMFAKLSPDGKRAAYVRANNIFVEEIDSGSIRQLTQDGSQTIINGTSDWVYEEELAVRDGFLWSPDGKHIAYWHFDSSGVGNFSLINNTDATYPSVKLIPYPKAGTSNSAVSIGVVSSSGGKTRWMQVPGDPRDNYIARMEWAGPAEIVMQHLNRLQNTNDVLIATISSGATKSIFRDQDKAWVDVVDNMQWIHQQTEFTWLSERDGWRRAYVVSRDGKQLRPVTPAGVDVIRFIAVDEQEEWLYYIASTENATQRYLYRARLDGHTAERLTPQSAPGTHNYQIAPDGRWAIHTYSAFDRPPVIDLVRLPGHEPVRTLQDNAALRTAVAPLVKNLAEFFQVKVDDGVTLDGWMIKPDSFNPAKKYPLLMYVYGEPANVTVVNRWGGQRELFHYALANEGYIVASVDNRGTPAPKGRDWRKVVYGAVGVLSAKEQAAAVRELVRTRPYLEANRVAVWGWSGGGSNTLNCMFRYPGVYQVGLSVASVPDQSLYDTIYQERYMGLPKDNPDGYRDGSPINFAAGLKGKLLMLHGTGDDNVHYQGFERLVNRLIELGKPFDMMTYPNRTHSISEGKGTALHVHMLLSRYLETNLPPAR